MAKWIWLPAALYPDRQRCRTTVLYDNGSTAPYSVAIFTASYAFGRRITSVTLTITAETYFSLQLNDISLFQGPAWIGRDFLLNEDIPDKAYAFQTEIMPETVPDLQSGRLKFRVLVRMNPVRMFESSRGRGALFLDALVHFDDGSSTRLGTDGTWLVSLEQAYLAPGIYDGTKHADPPCRAEPVPGLCDPVIAPIPPCANSRITPPVGALRMLPGETVRRRIVLDCVYAGNLCIACHSPGQVRVLADIFEVDEQEIIETDTVVLSGRDAYTSLELQSIGGFRITAENLSDEPAALEVSVLTSFYPTSVTAVTQTSDKDLNAVWLACRHALKYCRQTLHLDSPKHCEPMACTGDYWIETQMTLFTFGDMRLAAFDVRRTADMLVRHDGRMFHTTYSLLWVQMLYDVYRYTGEKQLLLDCLPAIRKLLCRFEGYVGENGLLETPPDYMFNDWLYVDGYSLHHPPKALGQTCLNLFWFGALKTAEEIWRRVGDTAEAEACMTRTTALHRAIFDQLWDPERRLFFEGLNTRTDASLLGEWMPANTKKRYYRMHANVLACFFGFFDRTGCRNLLHRILHEEKLGEIQPYFQHFLLDAVVRNGLRETETLRLLESWKASLAICPKGLAEGFFKPEATYRFDHSHAWAGTPAYALPLAISGLRILEPGFRKIALSPSLLGLGWACVEIPTPLGMIRLNLQQGREAEIDIPPGIACVSVDDSESRS